MSLPEVLLWRKIQPRHFDGPHIRRQHPFGPYTLDFTATAPSSESRSTARAMVLEIVQSEMLGGMLGWQGKGSER
jgi:hypothetical protein